MAAAIRKVGIRDYVGHFKTLNDTERRANDSDRRDGAEDKKKKELPPEPSMAQVCTSNLLLTRPHIQELLLYTHVNVRDGGRYHQSLELHLQ